MITKDIFKRKKHLLLLLSIYALLYLLIRVLTFYAHSLSVLEFAFLAMFFGLGPAYYFRNVFKFENIIGWLVNSSVLGLLFIPFLFVVLGWMGINFVFVYSTFFLYICSLLGMVLLFVFVDDASVKHYFNFNGLAKDDIWFYTLFSGYTLILTLQNFHHVYIQWDAFTFWGLDAKYIFQLNHLRDSTLDVFGSFRYTAYYPVYYSIIYDLYGAVVEQYANWINVFLNLLALLLVYNNTLQKSVGHKLLIATTLLVVSYTAVLVVNMLSMYADVLCAFNLLLFMLVLTSKYELEPETYGKRMFLLLLLAISFYFIKSPFIIFTCLLIFIYVLYDLKFLLNNRDALARRIDFWLAIVVVVSLCVMWSYYFAVTLPVGNDTPVISELYHQYMPRFVSPYSSISYTVTLIAWLFNRSPYLVGLWSLGMLSIFLVNKQRPNKSYYYIYGISLGVVLLYSAAHVINQTDLTSGSLIRYSAIVMYLIPLMLTHIEINLPRIQSIALTTMLLALSVYIVIKTMTPMPLFEQFTLSTGSYNVVLKREFRIAEKTLKISGDTARILVADDFSDNSLLSNMYIDAIKVRYFLMFNSVGGQYVTTTENLYEYALSQNADYILLLSYANTLENCGKLLVENGNYLIKIHKGKSSNLDECIFANDTIFDLPK